MFSLQLGEMYTALRLDSSPFMKGAAAITQSVTRLQSTIETGFAKMEQSFVRTGVKMSAAITAPLAVVSKQAVNTFSQFDDAMTQSTAIMTGMSEQQRIAMENVARTISEKSVTSATDLAKSYYYLASAGMSAEQAMSSLAQVNKFAVAGQFDMALATELLAGAQGALGMKSADTAENLKMLTHLSDVLVNANVLANASVQQFSEAIMNGAGSAMKNFNIKLEEGIAILAAYADQGIKGAVAGSNLERMSKFLIKALNENGDAFKRMGIAGADAFGNLQIQKTIKDMTKVLGSMGATAKSAKLKELGFEIDAQNTILPLLGTAEAIAGYEKKLLSAGGFTEKVFNNQMKSFAAQMQRVWNVIDNVRQAIGRKLVPYLTMAANYAETMVAKWRLLTPAMQWSAIKIAAAAAAMGPLLLAAAALTPILAGVASTALAMASPFNLAAIAFSGMATAIISHTDTGKTAWNDFVSSMTKTVSDLSKKVTDFANRWKENFKQIAAVFDVDPSMALRLFTAKIKLEFAQMFEAVAGYLQEFYDLFSSPANTLVEWSTTIAKAFLQMGQTIRNVFNDIADLAASTWKKATEARNKIEFGIRIQTDPELKKQLHDAQRLQSYPQTGKKMGASDIDTGTYQGVYDAWLEANYPEARGSKRDSSHLSDPYEKWIADVEAFGKKLEKSPVFPALDFVGAAKDEVTAAQAHQKAVAQQATDKLLAARANQQIKQVTDFISGMFSKTSSYVKNTTEQALQVQKSNEEKAAKEKESPLDGKNVQLGGGFHASTLLGATAGGSDKVAKDQLQVQKDILQELKGGGKKSTGGIVSISN